MPLPCVENRVVINNPQGLHARPAEMLARLAMQFESEVELVRDDQIVDAKSILHLLTLGAAQGTEVVLQARGSDAQEAIEAITRLVQSDFESDETLSQESSG